MDNENAPFTTPFSRTDLSLNNKFHRLIHKLESRLLYFKEQVDYRQTSPNHFLYVTRLERFEFLANRHIELLKRGGNNFNYNKTLGDIRHEAYLRWLNKRERHYKEAYDWCKDWGTRNEHIKKELGIEIEYKGVEESQWDFLIKLLEDTSYETSLACIKSKLQLQIYDAFMSGWFISFGTLTVNPEHYRLVFETGSKAWRYYIRDMKLACGKRYLESKGWSMPSKRDVEKITEDYFHYLAVVEEGSQNGRLHIHVLLFMKEPIRCSDPNYSLQIPYRREIKGWEQYWPYGISQYIAVRFSNSDPWGKRGWSWPVRDDCQPIEPTNPDKLSEYLCKYILKAKLNHKGEVTPWRTRTNNRMGKTKLIRTLQTMPMEMVKSLVFLNKYPRKIKLYGNPVPTKLIRGLAVKELLYRNRNLNQEALPRDTTLKTLLRSSTLRKHDRRSMNSGSIIVQLLNGRDISNSCIHDNFIMSRSFLEAAFEKPTVNRPVSGGSTWN